MNMIQIYSLHKYQTDIVNEKRGNNYFTFQTILILVFDIITVTFKNAVSF